LSVERRWETATDSAGDYRFDDLLPGVYLLEIADPPLYFPTTSLRYVVGVQANAIAAVPAAGFYRLPWIIYLPVALRE